MIELGGIVYYTSRAEAARGYGVSKNSMCVYLRKGKVQRMRFGASGILIPVGQHGEDKLKGWPKVRRSHKAGAPLKIDTIVPRRPYPKNRKPRKVASA